MIDFFKTHKENISFTLFIVFFILGLKNIAFMYASMFFVLLYFLGREGKQGVVFGLLLMGLGVVVAFVLENFGDIGKYFVIVFGVLYMIFVLRKRLKGNKCLWCFWDEAK